MPSIFKLPASHFKKIERTDFVGDDERLFYTVNPFKLYISDGETPGGTEIVLGASQEYVDTRISELIDGAPDLLNTLDELASAVNDDTNFATWVNNRLAEKLNISEFGNEFDLNLASVLSDEIAEGTTNLYYSDARVDTYLQSGNTDKIIFDTVHENGTEVAGTLCWDSSDGTLNITHAGGVTQQVGQEQYAYVRNESGTTIINGTVVGFAGAGSENGEARLLVDPYQANGLEPSLYTVGIATHDITNNTNGRVTVFGKVRDVNTTGTDVGETWAIGDILYASPTHNGKMTRVKPSVPNNVVPVAAVLKLGTTDGELFVRPTIEQKMSYGVFDRTTNLIISSVNTAYPVEMNVTEVSNGVTLVPGNTSRMMVDQSGLFQIDVTVHFDTTGGFFDEDSWYMWLRKNGTDIPNTMRRGGIDGEVPSGTSPSFTRVIAMDVSDYVELVVASSSTDVRVTAEPATSFGPSTAAAEVTVAQIQL